MKIMDEANVMIRYDMIQKPYNDFKSLIFVLFLLIFVPFSIVIKRLIVRQNDIISTSKFFCR